jgi:2-methylisocitrate lyase-like PEP mutase family enzyme
MNMNKPDHIVLANRFQDLNFDQRLLLPNVWDAASARIFEEAGFPAIGTTSGGIANCRGVPDGERMGRDMMMREIKAIVDAVTVPVTADVEAGYGDTPTDVAETVDVVLDLGAVGINLEDRAHRASVGSLYKISDQAVRVEAARGAADRRGIPLVINARTDTFLIAVGDTLEERIAATIDRGNAYLRAGADLVFVPAVVDLDVIRRLAHVWPAQLSVMAMPGAPAAKAFFDAGATRVSLGSFAMLATFGALRDMARDIKESGVWSSMERTFYGYREAELLFAERT